MTWGYFDTIDREKLMVLVSGRISDRRVLKLIRKWLLAGLRHFDARPPSAGS